MDKGAKQTHQGPGQDLPRASAYRPRLSEAQYDRLLRGLKRLVDLELADQGDCALLEHLRKERSGQLKHATGLMGWLDDGLTAQAMLRLSLDALEACAREGSMTAERKEFYSAVSQAALRYHLSRFPH